MTTDCFLNKALLGFESFVTNRGEMDLTLTWEVAVQNKARVYWLVENLPDVAAELAAFTGGAVTQFSVKYPDVPTDYYGNYPKKQQPQARLVFGLKLLGSISTDAIPAHSTAHRLSGFLKKELALWIMENFVPSIDVKKPLLPAGTWDVLVVRSATDRTSWGSTIPAVHEAKEPQALAGIRAAIEARGGKSATTVYQHFSEIQFEVVWQQPTSEEVRKSLCESVKRVIEEIFGYTPRVSMMIR